MNAAWDYTMVDVGNTDALGWLGDHGWEAVGIGDGKILLKRRTERVLTRVTNDPTPADHQEIR